MTVGCVAGLEVTVQDDELTGVCPGHQRDVTIETPDYRKWEVGKAVGGEGYERYRRQGNKNNEISELSGVGGLGKRAGNDSTGMR